MKQIGKSILQGLAGITICINIVSCSSKQEIRVSDAKPGDTLVVVGDERIVLVEKFKPGQPNGLFDGSVKIISKNKPERLTEVISATASQHFSAAVMPIAPLPALALPVLMSSNWA